MGLPYAKEIDRYMIKPGLIVHESDIEIAPETFQRFETYVWNKPDRIHSCPYLIRYEAESQQEPRVVWIHRSLRAKTADKLPKKTFKKMLYYMPQGIDASQVIITAAIPIQGGEPESEYYGLGLTYLPYTLWQKIREQVIDLDWTVLDTRTSIATAMLGEKSLIHWDCLVCHNTVLNTVREFKEKYGLVNS